jgi:hypothetical protein
LGLGLEIPILDVKRLIAIMKKHVFLLICIAGLPIAGLLAQNTEASPKAKPAAEATSTSPTKAAPAAKPATALAPATESKTSTAPAAETETAPTAAPSQAPASRSTMAPGRPAFAPRTSQQSNARMEPAQKVAPVKEEAPKE